MLRRCYVFPFCLLVILLAVSCTNLGVDQEATSTAGALMTLAVAQTAAQATQDMSVELTAQAQATAEAEAASIAAANTATQAAIQVAATRSAEETSQAAKNATVTQQAKFDKEKTAQFANVTATAMRKTEVAQPMFDYVNQLGSDRIIENTFGQYFALETFNEDWAQLGWFQFYETGISTNDFVLRTHFDWDSASDKADPWYCGCGFVFRAKDTDNYYMTYLGLDGYVYLYRFKGGNSARLGYKYYDKVGFPQGSADFTLIAENDSITILVNETKTLHIKDQTFSAGDLYYTLVSGTNKGYGFHCKMTDVSLWKMK